METPDVECYENTKERKRAKQGNADKSGKKNRANSALKMDDEASASCCGSDLLNKTAELDDTLLQHHVLTEILNVKKRELLESDTIINALFPFKTEKE